MNRSQAHVRPYQVIRASAGTGKTFQLSSRYIGLLYRGVPVEQILATTFTKKAAGEIMERILLRLAKATLLPDERVLLANSIFVPELTTEECSALLKTVTSNLHRVRISTLDSFFAQLARTHGLEMGLPPRWQIADEFAHSRLQDQAISAVLKTNSESVLSRIMHLVGIGQANRSVAGRIRSKSQSLYETYRSSAAQAWNELPRNKPLEQTEFEELLVQLKAAALPQDKRAVGARAADVERAATGQWEEVLKKGLAGKVLQEQDTFHKKEIPPETIALYKQLLKHVRAVLVGQLANQNVATYELLEKYAEQIQNVKTDKQLFTFDDIKHCVNRWTSADDRQRWSYRLDAPINHLLLDEFQDTSVEQWQVLNPLADRVLSDAQGTLFCVGDTKQAIYGWRGGVAEIFSVVEEKPQVDLDSISRSFRFGPVVADCTNEIFRNIGRHPGLGDDQAAIEKWVSQFNDHESVHLKKPGYISIETTRLPEAGGKQADATLNFAAERIAELADNMPRCSIGVLLRKNASVAKLTYELNRRGVVASEEGGQPLTDSAAVRLILSVLSWADQPGDTIAWFHTAHSPLSNVLGLDASASPRARARKAAEVRATLFDNGYGETIRNWAEALVPSTSSREASRLRQLVELAYKYETQATLRPGDFVRLAKQHKASSPEAVRVRVMTIHQAKGLQFDAVVLAELDDDLIRKKGSEFATARDGTVGPIHTVCLERNKKIRALLPAKMQTMFAETRRNEIAEALSRLYVAVTRPVYALYMIIAPSKANEKSIPRTNAGLLRAALIDTKPLPEQTQVYEKGDPEWYGKLRQDTIQTPAMESVADVSTATIRQLLPESTPRPQWTSPSKLGHGQAGRIFDGFSSDRVNAFLRGTVIHAWLEKIEWLDAGMPNDELLRGIALKNGVGVELTQKLMEEFREMLKAGSTSHWLRKQAYQPPAEICFPPEVQSELATAPLELEVRNEQRIACQQNEHLLMGNIDRLVLMRQSGKLLAADVVDYKTDSLPEGDTSVLDSLVDRYRPQLAAYRHAVSQMFQLPEDRISARLMFLATGEVVDL